MGFMNTIENCSQGVAFDSELLPIVVKAFYIAHLPLADISDAGFISKCMTGHSQSNAYPI